MDVRQNGEQFEEVDCFKSLGSLKADGELNLIRWILTATSGTKPIIESAGHV